MFVIDDSSAVAGSDEMSEIGKFNNELKDQGHFVMAEGIKSGEQAAIFDNRGGHTKETSGSLYDISENYSGFWIIEVENDDRARSSAQSASRACNRKIELPSFLQLTPR
ncbi:YciI family protein [Aurantimicrobium minutum]|uniref:YciI family protein n=1 Tax=Aurantimicrobium minutum TaxID=708131 RepID=UPI002476FDB0|nr:YciI family protein [Aurantimicrobium minutum]